MKKAKGIVLNLLSLFCVGTICLFFVISNNLKAKENDKNILEDGKYLLQLYPKTNTDITLSSKLFQATATITTNESGRKILVTHSLNQYTDSSSLIHYPGKDNLMFAYTYLMQKKRFVSMHFDGRSPTKFKASGKYCMMANSKITEGTWTMTWHGQAKEKKTN